MSSKLLIDTHCHLDFPQFKKREEVIQTCKEKLKAVITSGTKFYTNKKALELSKKHKGFIFCTLGCHPTYPKEQTEKKIEQVKNQIIENKSKIVGVGEVGLDYFHIKDNGQREKQKEIFIQFIELAEELKLPLVLHTRDAEKHAFNIIKDYNVQATFHCFNGDILLLEKIQKQFFISISTQAVYSKRVKEIIQNVDLNRILLETDSPFLWQGEINHPWNIQYTLEKISDTRKIDKEELSKIILRNTKNLFKF